MKRIILFSIIAVVSIIAKAQHYFVYEGLRYEAFSLENGASVTLINPSGADLSNLIIPDTVEYEGYKFYVGSIALYAFKGNENLISVTMPNTIRHMELGVFSGCKNLINVILSNSLQYISKEAFYGCTSLTNITIPYSVRTIYENAFHYCENLTDINCLPITPPKMMDYLGFYPAYYMATLHVPERSVEAYKATEWWSSFLNIEGDAADSNPVYHQDKCDTNGDGEVNIADVNTVINRILSK